MARQTRAADPTSGRYLVQRAGMTKYINFIRNAAGRSTRASAAGHRLPPRRARPRRPRRRDRDARAGPWVVRLQDSRLSRRPWAGQGAQFSEDILGLGGADLLEY